MSTSRKADPFFLVLCVCLLGAPRFARGALTFFSPAFEHLDRSELESLAKQSETQKSIEARHDQLLVAFFTADLETVSGHPHAARAALNRAEEICDEWEADTFRQLPELLRARAGYACALTRMELLTADTAGFKWGRTARMQDDLTVGQLGILDSQERWYAEGRAFFELSPADGRDLRTSLMALSLLERARPDLPSVAYWLGRAHETRGNRDRAREAFERALAAGGVLARLAFPTGVVRLPPEDQDGVRYGWHPGIFSSPTQGFGARLGYSDDRLFDTRRSATVEGAAGTRSYWHAGARYSDAEIVRPVKLSLRADFQSRVEDFYGLGIGSALTDHSELKMNRGVAEVAAEEALDGSPDGPLKLRLGWRQVDFRLQSATGTSFATAALPSKGGIALGNPFGELVLDTRDSRVEPRTGVYFSVRGDFPTTSFGSPRSYQLWRAEGHSYWELLPGQVFTLGVGYAAVVGDAPFAEFPALGGTLSLPGMRAFRFQDRSIAAEVAEYRARIFGPLSLALFTMGGTATTGSVFSSTQQVGFGAGALYQFSSDRAPLLRLELGHFGGETIVQAEASSLW